MKSEMKDLYDQLYAEIQDLRELVELLHIAMAEMSCYLAYDNDAIQKDDDEQKFT